MQALVLAGGEGTRLRPLTYTTPKPVMPLAGRPFLSFMLDWLRAHGVEEVILSCGFMSDGVKRVLGDIYDGMLGGAAIAGSALEALDGADAAVLVTEWPEFAELDWGNDVRHRMRVPLVVDGRNFLDRAALEAAGFTYEGIGR